MRVLILGGGGMLGHKLSLEFRDQFDTWLTIRSELEIGEWLKSLEYGHVIRGIDVTAINTVQEAIAASEPDVIINCVGIIKQRPEAEEFVSSIKVNSLFPHQLANLCAERGIRLIHISTDCVFSGEKGMYTEADVADAKDTYGKTKYLGEIDGEGCLTIRTSIIGRELHTSNGIVEWFLGNDGGKVKGFRRSIFSGFSTIRLAEIISFLIVERPELSGLYHVSSEKISKYDLLLLLRDAYGLDVEIEPDDELVVDRSLDSRLFREAAGFQPPAWTDMIQQMAVDKTPYEVWRKRHVV